MSNEYNNVKKIKIMFSIMAVIFFFTIVTGQYLREINTKYVENYPFYNSLMSLTYVDQIILNKIIYRENLDSDLYKNCTFKTPKKNTIILRLDDFGAGHYKDIVEKITNDVLFRNLSISFAVIPNNIEKDRKLLSWTRTIKDNSHIEFALHGYYHTPEEFGTMKYVDSIKYLDLGKKKMMDYMHVVPVTFVPPYNVYSDGTETALKDLNFKILSAGKNDIDLSGDLTKLGYTSTTYRFGEEINEDGYYVRSSVTINDCSLSLNKNNICVVMIHPQDYLEPQSKLSNNRNLDEDRYNDFLSLLNGLQELDAEFKNYKDLLECN